MKRILWVWAFVVGLVGINDAAAQFALGRFSVEPHFGLFSDGYDISTSGTRLAPIGGLRVGYQLSRRARLVGNVALSRSQDVAFTPKDLEDHYVYDNNWTMTTADLTYDVSGERTSLVLGLQAGAGWRQVVLDGQVGTPGTSPDPAGDEGYTALGLLVPGVYVRQQLFAGTALILGLEDHLIDVFDNNMEHGVGLSVGFSFR